MKQQADAAKSEKPTEADGATEKKVEEDAAPPEEERRPRRRRGRNPEGSQAEDGVMPS
jgi:hypothetical protein